MSSLARGSWLAGRQVSLLNAQPRRAVKCGPSGPRSVPPGGVAVCWFAGAGECGGRQREIQTFLDSANLNSENASWVALDDMPLFFEDGYPNLILTDSSRGFDESNGDALLAWYKNALDRD